MIVVVEGPSAAGKTTWCREHATRWLPEPGRWPMAKILQYQIDRWHTAVAEDARGEVVVLDGDPFKLYYSWAAWRVGTSSDAEWGAVVEATRQHFVARDYGLADLVLYSDPGEDELRRRMEGDDTRSRRNFELHLRMRPYFRQWYEAVALIDRGRVIWNHPPDGLTEDRLGMGRRSSRSDPDLFDALLASLLARP